jgi:hypothetical protein
MIGLTDSQFEILELRLKKAGLKKTGLYHDLLDHFYCETEALVYKGIPFETAMERAFNQLAPDGVQAIEEELFFLLTFNKQLSMNRLLYVGGFIATVGQTLYVLFRTLHWPGAQTCLILACGALFLMVIPALIYRINRNYSQLTQSTRYRILAGLLGIGLFGGGSFFKIMHWPSANIQILLGTGLLALVFFPIYFWQEYQKSKVQLA